MAAPSGTTPKLLLPYPIDDDQVDVPRDIKALADKLDVTVVPAADVPIGALMMWPTALAPDNWLLCNGGSVPAATYPALATVLGQDGGGNVLLPNLVGRFPLGSSGTHALKEQAGAEAVSLTKEQSGLPAHGHANSFGIGAGGGHAHSVYDPAHGHSNTTIGAVYNGSGVGQAVNVTQRDFLVALYRAGFNSDAAYTGIGIYPVADHGHALSGGVSNNAGVAAEQPHPNMPPFFVVNFIIRAR
jgi:microcystin-dependent protein